MTVRVAWTYVRVLLNKGYPYFFAFLLFYFVAMETRRMLPGGDDQGDGADIEMIRGKLEFFI